MSASFWWHTTHTHRRQDHERRWTHSKQCAVGAVAGVGVAAATAVAHPVWSGSQRDIAIVPTVPPPSLTHLPVCDGCELLCVATCRCCHPHQVCRPDALPSVPVGHGSALQLFRALAAWLRRLPLSRRRRRGHSSQQVSGSRPVTPAHTCTQIQGWRTHPSSISKLHTSFREILHHFSDVAPLVL